MGGVDFFCTFVARMGAMEKIRGAIGGDLDALNGRIRESLLSGNGLMNRVVEHYLESKGKQIRPMLVLLTARLFGEVNERVIGAAAAVEMLHNATLIHDDVVDESKIRRGMATVNALWDNQIAVLVGDFFVSTALQQAIGTGDLRIVRSLAHLGQVLSLGEVDQINTAREHCMDEEGYYKIISYKTASLFVSCVQMGAYAVGEDGEGLRRMERYAELLGLCFQIRDDVFDYYTDPEVGKPTANDLREGKVTLPLIYALRREGHPDREAMCELAAKDSLDDVEIERLVSYAKECGGIDYAYESMERLRREAMGILDEMGGGETVELLRGVFDYIIERRL